MRALPGNCEAEFDLFLLAKIAKKAKLEKKSLKDFITDSVVRFIEPEEQNKRSAKDR